MKQNRTEQLLEMGFSQGKEFNRPEGYVLTMNLNGNKLRTNSMARDLYMNGRLVIKDATIQQIEEYIILL